MKTILIIDKPKTCERCRVRVDDRCRGKEFGNNLLEQRGRSYEYNYNDKNCPLKVMPEELITPYMFRQEMIALGLQNEDGSVAVYSDDYMEGWNDCIQALLGEDEILGGQ